jgi:hypothetical protein
VKATHGAFDRRLFQTTAISYLDVFGHAKPFSFCNPGEASEEPRPGLDMDLLVDRWAEYISPEVTRNTVAEWPES